MSFLLQSDPVLLIERRTIQHAAMLKDFSIQSIPLERIHTLQFNPTLTPVGTVEFVQAWMQHGNISTPPHITYPDCLQRECYLKRTLKKGTFKDAHSTDFIKPLEQIKAFTGDLKRNLPDLHENTPVWISTPVEFLSEWRYYVLNGVILGCGRYDDSEHDSEPDISLIHDALKKMTDNGAPQGYAMDFGVLQNGETALVEVNDGWALGYYKGNCSPVSYAKILQARWSELCAQYYAPKRSFNAL